MVPGSPARGIVPGSPTGTPLSWMAVLDAPSSAGTTNDVSQNGQRIFLPRTSALALNFFSHAGQVTTGFSAMTGPLFRRSRNRAGLADEKGHADILVTEDFGAIDASLFGEILLAVTAGLDVEPVRPARLLHIGRRRLEVLAGRCDGDRAGFANEDELAGGRVVEHLDAELARGVRERLLVVLAAGEIQAVQPIGGLAVALDCDGLGGDGDRTRLADEDQIAGV